MRKQVTINGKTWCKEECGWIGPNYQAPSRAVRAQLDNIPTYSESVAWALCGAIALGVLYAILCM